MRSGSAALGPTAAYARAICSFKLFVAAAALAAGGNLGLPGASVPADNWHQWRGPLANGTSPSATPPVTWSETENVKWKVKIPGRGTATPIVWGDQIFIQTAIATGKKAAIVEPRIFPPVLAGQATPPSGNNPPERRRGRPPGAPGGGGGINSEKPTETYQFVLLSLERQTGKVRWQKVAREEVPHEGHHRDHGFSSQSPITDGSLVVSYFGSHGLYCYDFNGNLKWQKDLGRQQTKNSFGEGSSPALSGDTVIVNWDHEGDDFIAAFDKNTGQELWRTPREESTGWSTPLIVEHGGKRQVVVNATRKVRSYDLATGKLLWECGGQTDNAIPSPVAVDDTVYVTSGFRGSTLQAIKLGRTGDLAGGDAIAWSKNKGTPYVPSPLLDSGKLYLFAGNNAILSCFDAKSGQALIDGERIEALQGVYASPVGAAGRVYLVGRNGVTAVLKRSDKLEVIATNRLDEKIDASPALVGREMFLRGHEYLYCLAEK